MKTEFGPLNAKVLKRSISIAGHATSISLEEPFWEELKTLAAKKQLSLPMLIAEIDSARESISLSSALRLTVINRLRKA